MKLFDHYIIRVNNIWEETVIGGVQMMNGLRYIDKERDRYDRKRRYGIVVSEPAGLSGKNHNFIDPGWPNPRIHIGHDLIQEKVNMGFDEYTDYERFYNLAVHEEIAYDTLADYPTDAKSGEVVYFHPSVTEPENKIGPGLYKCRTDLLVCVIEKRFRRMSWNTYNSDRSEEWEYIFRMQANYVLVEPIAKEDTAAGLILSVDTQNELLRGRLKDGSEVLFRDYADWQYEILGKKYYAMREEDILMTV